MESRLFPVKVFDGKGRLQKTISTKELIVRHWSRYKKNTVTYRRGKNLDFLYVNSNKHISAENKEKGGE